MVACFGLHDGCPRFPAVLLVERNLRLSIWQLLEQGMLVEGTVSRVVFEGTGGSQRPIREVEIRREVPNVWIDGTRVLVGWHSPKPESCHPYFECPICSRRCRHVYLRDRIACRRCHRLDWSCRHVGRQTPGVARVARFRRRLGDCDVRPFAPLPAAPTRGRSRGFHERLVAAIQAEEAALLGHLQTVTRDLERRIRVRKERGKW